MFPNCHLISQDHVIYGKKTLNVSHHPAKFGDHKHCGRTDIMVLVCHVILQDLMSKAHMTLWVEPLMDSCQPAKCESHRHFGSGDITLLVVEECDPRCSLKSTIAVYL